MRAFLTTVMVLASLAAAGCNIFEGYVYKPVHYRFATVSEREYAMSVDKAYKHLQFVLRERQISIQKAERKEEAARIIASTDGLEMTCDITSVGEGSKVHIEVNQAGNDKLVWAILQDLSLMP